MRKNNYLDGKYQPGADELAIYGVKFEVKEPNYGKII